MNPELTSGGRETSFFGGNDHRLQTMFNSVPPQQHDFSSSIANHPILNAVKPDPGWPDFGGYGGQLGYGYMNQNTVGVAEQRFTPANSVSVSPKKRKADKGQSLQVVSEKDKKIKGCAEEGDSKITHQYSNDNNSNSTKEASTNNNGSISKEKSKVSEVQKPDYIHVRARRGQATDSHSLAERVRREKISERMKYLQDLVPGCNKITGKAGMLDEIINYVQSLQKQVEFLSMKLATVNPELDFNIESVFTKEVLQSPIPGLGCSSETANSAYFQINSMEQLVSYCGLDMGINSTEMALRRSISSPIPIPETFMDSSCYNQIQASATWDADLQNLYKMEFEQGTLIPFQSHQFTGLNEGSNMKMEM